MADYLIEQYNAKVAAIQDREAKALTGALEAYTAATLALVEAAALERVEAGAALAASMSQRDHEYHNGRPVEVVPTPELPKVKSYSFAPQPEIAEGVK